MRESFLPYLADPETGAPLELVVEKRQGDDVVAGALVSGANRYPIVRGIPRFAGFEADGAYAASFGYQWNRWKRVQFDCENAGRPMEGHTRRMWERITGIAGLKKDDVIAEFGCGAGRFLATVREKGGLAIGLDLSGAVEAAAANFSGDAGVLICQADALKPPLRAGGVDGAYSIGVLHHTPSPSAGVTAMARSVKEDGWVAVCVYPKGSYYDSPRVRALRALFKLLKPLFGFYPPLVYSYFAAYALNPLARLPVLGLAVKALFPFARLPDARWALLDTFDSLTPVHQTGHETFEVFQWLKTAGLSNIEPADWGPTAFRAAVKRQRRLAGAAQP